MTGGHSYGSPGAFRRALTDKPRVLAAGSRWTLQQLRRQMAYDRLLERLYLVDEGWIVKGATALLGGVRTIWVRGDPRRVREWQGRQVRSGSLPEAQTSWSDEFCLLQESDECR